MEQKLIRQLLLPATYPETTQSVTLLQTHISFLFLTDNYVYKIKKPVDLGFLNFTTLDRRRFYCEEEVRLNRRLCPEVYLGVEHLKETRNGITFGGEGTTVEYAVKMKRLPEDRMLDRLIRDDRITEKQIRLLAQTVASFHLKAERSTEIARCGDISIIKHNWDENFRQTARFVGDTIKRLDLELIREWVDEFLSQNEEFLAERVARGFIRDCNGDIHCENICITDKEGICIFDCIEFNERFRYIDTAADFAFLLMDLDYHNRKSFADAALEEYRVHTGDDGIIFLLDLYRIYSAYVRGKVESFRLVDTNIGQDQKNASRLKAGRYFRLARGYILRRKLPPAIILFSGLMGTGKSTIASEIGFELGIELVRSDVERKKIAGIPQFERELGRYGEGIYSAGWNRATYERLLAAAEKALTEGRGIIIDASFHKKSDRSAFRKLAESFGVLFHIIFTECPEELVKERLARRMLDPLEPSDGRMELYHYQKSEYEVIGEEEGKKLELDTSKPLDDSLEAILEHLGLR